MGLIDGVLCTWSKKASALLVHDFTPHFLRQKKTPFDSGWNWSQPLDNSTSLSSSSKVGMAAPHFSPYPIEALIAYFPSLCCPRSLSRSIFSSMSKSLNDLNSCQDILSRIISEIITLTDMVQSKTYLKGMSINWTCCSWHEHTRLISGSPDSREHHRVPDLELESNGSDTLTKIVSLCF